MFVFTAKTLTLSMILAFLSVQSFKIINFRSRITHLKDLTSSNLGSDALERPEDENSPEFKEYLKKLLEMQANRAKQGFASPSSGSAAAYMAKLNRIKLERNALRRAGLSDEFIDTSYTPKDYEFAAGEMRDPVISATAAPASGGPRMRGLTEFEIQMAEAVKTRVEELRKMRESGEVPSKSTSSAFVPSAATNSPEIEAKVNEILGLDGISKGPPVETKKPKIDKAISEKNQVTQPTPVPAPAQLQSTPVNKTPSSPAAKKEVTPTDTSKITKAIKNIPQTLQEKPPVATQSKPKQTSNFGRKLDSDELDIAGKALQLLVKHRGGGPFGVGRLEGSDAEDLEKALLEFYQMMQIDTEKVLEGTKKETKMPTAEKTASVQEKTLKPSTLVANVAKPPAETPKPTVQSVKPTKPVAPVVPVTSQEVPVVEQPTVKDVATPSEGPKVMSLAKGIDEFLTDSKSMSLGELSSLRDGVIQLLSLLQNTINDREDVLIRSSPSTPQPTSPPPPIPSTAKAAAAPVGTSGMEQELKIALGMLLKHRGGPGFGHGRLQGEELAQMGVRLRDVAQKLISESMEKNN